MRPLSRNQLKLALAKPWPTRWANRPRKTQATTRRPKFARKAPKALTLWLAQVALSAKKKAARNEANIG